MSPKRIIGLLLVLLGVVALALGRVSWTRDKTVVDAGPVEIKTEKHESFALPPALGIISLVGGIALLAIPERRRV